MATSPDRFTFQREKYLKHRAEEGKTPDNDDTVKAMEDFFDSMIAQRQQQEVDSKWQENNMEYDLRTSEHIVAKCQSNSYAQNLYAAMCNTEWQKLDVMPILTDQTWSCSWRYAGGIVADLRGKGDYIDWYCSGIGGPMGGSSESDPEVEQILLARKGYVSEGTVTDEIAQDLRDLGWQQIDSHDE